MRATDSANTIARMDHQGNLSADGLRFALDAIDSAVVGVRDVVIVAPSTDREQDLEKDLVMIPRRDVNAFKEIPPDDVDLGEGISILRLDQELVDRVMHACSPRGHNFLPLRQFGQGYTISRDVSRDSWMENLYNWDPDGKIRDVLAMSRLIVDAGYSTEFAARIINYANGEQKIAWVPMGPGKMIYRVGKSRDWLTYEEAEELRKLLAARWKYEGELGDRLSRAMWNLEHAAGVGFLDVMVPLYVITLESFTNTDKSGVTRQFSLRAPRISKEAGGPDLSEATCRRFYDARSRWAHGEHIRLEASAKTAEKIDPAELPHGDVIEEFRAIQAATRAVVRRGIEDPSFRSKIETKKAIEANWPLPA